MELFYSMCWPAWALACYGSYPHGMEHGKQRQGGGWCLCWVGRVETLEQPKCQVAAEGHFLGANEKGGQVLYLLHSRVFNAHVVSALLLSVESDLLIGKWDVFLWYSQNRGENGMELAGTLDLCQALLLHC